MKPNLRSKLVEEYCNRQGMQVIRVDHYTVLVKINNNWLPFFGFDGPSISSPLQRILSYKHLTLRLLKNNNISVSPFTLFDKNNPKTLYEFAEKNYPIVLKPITGRKGKGIIFGIHDSRDLNWALQLFEGQSGWGLAEKYFEGEDFRAFVVDGKLISLTKRDAANILGDGKHTILQLINLKNITRRSLGEYYESRLIPTQIEYLDLLNDQGKSLKYVPAKNEKVYLKGAKNVSQGGESINCMDSVTPRLEKVLVNAVKSIPQLNYAAIDVMIKGDIKDQFSYVINELNYSFAATAMFPTHGETIDMVGPIIEFYKKWR